MKASLKNYRQAPRKVRLVTDLVKSKDVITAVSILKHTTKRAAPTIQKLVESAIANAEKNFGAKSSDLMIQNITVDKGVILKRLMPRAHGRSFPIHKHSSNVAIVLGAKTVKAKKEPKVKAVSVDKTKKTKK